MTVDYLGKTLDGGQIVFYPRSNMHAISLPQTPRSSVYGSVCMPTRALRRESWSR